MDRILENIVRDHREKNLDTKAVGEENGEDLVDVLLRLQRNGDHPHPMSDCCQSNVSKFLLQIYANLRR